MGYDNLPDCELENAFVYQHSTTLLRFPCNEYSLIQLGALYRLNALPLHLQFRSVSPKSSFFFPQLNISTILLSEMASEIKNDGVLFVTGGGSRPCLER
jgi:hypothetical protein